MLQLFGNFPASYRVVLAAMSTHQIHGMVAYPTLNLRFCGPDLGLEAINYLTELFWIVFILGSPT